ncbi:S-adenosylmethionine:tRNA ribosyltransferase-isomerase [Labilithrix luteola]|uniref:S-adenosylmethionine:tRNA ribosyltransferase-isomerase n=1 Tax=Labilithrix luteola TaxID=1391654 RepID=A0A0K1PZS5_9BACT|nr:S-adenosylmethionine:tRNA ribosyltransferase-isomerase [Labilithrix luteola]AKU98654.1 S-adenosylmethionine:tRNA ribosyltransferase-isomerase [Labilithrix luteola]
MSPATSPRPVAAMRLLVVDGSTGTLGVADARTFPELLAPGDLVVVNDAATLPASFAARTAAGEPVELRLAGRAAEGSEPRFVAALLGAGDYRTRTEVRPLPPLIASGARLFVGDELVAHVTGHSSISERLVELHFSVAEGSEADVWAAIYRAGRPVQYAHVPEPLALWDVQNVYAFEPWAVEMPSAGRLFRAETFGALKARGIAIARVTHAAGLSSTGDPKIDEALPLPERWRVPEETVRLVEATHARGGRVLAVGTSVVRALESASAGTTLTAGEGITHLKLGPGARRTVVDGVVTGVHEADTTHYALLGAFASAKVLENALVLAEHEDLLGHEFGDACLVWGSPVAAATRKALDRPAPVSRREVTQEGRGWSLA